MRILPIALLAGLAICSLAHGRQCGYETAVQIRQCNHERGIGDYSLNVTALLQFCRSSERESLSACFDRARGGCTIQTTDEQRALFSEGVSWYSKSLDYLCSQHSVIDASQGCLNAASGGIEGCSRSSNEQFMRDMRPFVENGPPSFEDTKRLAEGLGRNREECIYNLLRTNCDDGIAKVYGNFFYGMGVYIFDTANQRH